MPVIEIDANQLRALAERADSRRGRTVHLVRNKDGDTPGYDIADSPEVDGREIVLSLRTMDANPPFAQRSGTLRIMSEPTLELEDFPDQGIEKADAIFTSLVAVEKFVTRYYSQFRSPDAVAAMRNGFAASPNALALCHLPDSVETRANAGSPMTATGLFVLQPHQTQPTKLFAQPLDTFVAERR